MFSMESHWFKSNWCYFLKHYKVILSGSGFVPNICFIWDKVPEVAWWKVWAIWLIYLRWSAVLITMHLHICCGRPNIPRVCTRESNKKDKPSFVTKFAFKCISLCYRYRNQKKLWLLPEMNYTGILNYFCLDELWCCSCHDIPGVRTVNYRSNSATQFQCCQQNFYGLQILVVMHLHFLLSQK
jgi:hypothetical protein